MYILVLVLCIVYILALLPELIKAIKSFRKDVRDPKEVMYNIFNHAPGTVQFLQNDWIMIPALVVFIYVAYPVARICDIYRKVKKHRQ